MLQKGLTPKLSGARPHFLRRSYFIYDHRFPARINEYAAACPLQRKLGAYAGYERELFRVTYRIHCKINV
jgi:hypothetical protein